MVEIEILGMVITHQYGVLNTGDILRTDAEFAEHLVDDCKAAKYKAIPVPAEDPPEVKEWLDATALEAETEPEPEPEPEPEATKPAKKK